MPPSSNARVGLEVPGYPLQGTAVKLQRSEEALEIRIPSKTETGLVIATLWLLGICFLVTAIIMVGRGRVAAAVIMFVLVGIMALLHWPVIKNHKKWKQENVLHIDQDFLTLTDGYGSKSWKTIHIVKASVQHEDSSNEVQTAVRFFDGGKEHTIGKGVLNEVEAEWIAAQINLFLAHLQSKAATTPAPVDAIAIGIPMYPGVVPPYNGISTVPATGKSEAEMSVVDISLDENR